ncbi:sugar ABC transporter substrate-binding protein [Alkalicella caledoniensis]|uniref:Sugar ABC transporter substrate-binding protein n=1 Tax=Alkalicella caledoniensis TaxID=2731377 RepID=A0A7G9W9V9_ALKCA|nr:hypothetical protein [Alkalicella caledoniensis]QNO15471.1 sugar ABC transporter substrate-binding protein [Alkalicella caledoniensis]
MKKGLSLLLIAILALSLAACSGGSNDDPKGEALTAEITVQVEEDWLAYYEAAKARVLENNPDAKIEFIVTGSFDHLNVLDDTDVTNEDVADVFAIPADRIYTLSQNEALAALDAKAMASNVGGFSNYDAGLGGNFKVNGEYLAFPMNIETLITFANPANAEDLDVDLSGSVELTEVDFETILIPVFDAWFGVAVANAGGIELLGKDAQGNLFSDMTKDFADLNQQQQDVLTALYDYWKTHHQAGTDLWDEDAAWGYMDTQFAPGGNTALRIEGPWSTGNLTNHAGGNVEILPIGQVTIAGHPLTHWQGGWGLAVNSRVELDEEKMLLSQLMIEEIMNTDYAVDLFKATGKIMENVPTSVYLNSDLSATDKAVIEAVIESYEEAPARPLFTEWGQVWDTWKNSLLSWSSVNPQSVEEAYEQMKASFDALMANF